MTTGNKAGGCLLDNSPIYLLIFGIIPLYRLNDELLASGYIIVAGRISRNYFEQKVYGGLIA